MTPEYRSGPFWNVTRTVRRILRPCVVGAALLGSLVAGFTQQLSIPSEVELVSSRARWRYLDSGIELSEAWRLPGLDDRSWPEGGAPLGYGEGDESTTLWFGPDPFNRFMTTYFRKGFQLTNAASFDVLYVDVMADDGAVGYLNGIELFRLNLPPGAISSATAAVTNVVGAQETNFVRLTLPARGLTGSNVLAVEVHQASRTSPDLRFDLRLVATNSFQLVRGPYLQSGTSNGAVVRWRTAVSNSTWLGYGTNPSGLAESYFDPVPRTEHEVVLQGLLPGTSYHYRIGSGVDGAVRGDGGVFRTDSSEAQPTRIWAIGDSGTFGASQRSVRDAYMNEVAGRRTDVWLMLGDNAYGTGSDLQYQLAVFEVYRALLPHTFLWPTIGNHDVYSGPSMDDFPYLNIFTLPSEGQAGGVRSGTEKYYSFNWANIHFVCLDSMASDRSELGPMSVWLRADLAQNDREWLIAYWHHPPYSAGSHNSDVEVELIEMRESIVPILEAHGVDLVLSGHSHSYERSYLLHGHYGHSGMLEPQMKLNAGDGRESGTGAYTKTKAGPNAGRGAVYVVAGCAGQTGFGTLNHPAMHVSLNVLGSMVIDVNGSRLDARFLRATGEIGDSFTLLKSPGMRPFRIVEQDVHNGVVTLHWQAVPGRAYQVETAPKVDSPQWVRKGGVVQAVTTVAEWSGQLESGTDEIYFRIVELP